MKIQRSNKRILIQQIQGKGLEIFWEIRVLDRFGGQVLRKTFKRHSDFIYFLIHELEFPGVLGMM